ncbi:MAG TPA: Ku protein [Candidatus Limnocylindria bacterium]|nr:Ku protein [Candidatus Limnocylindria bacterium]
MSQAVWTGSISFGLVTIPVKLYPATEPKDVRFHLYDRRTGRRVRYERVTREEEAPVFEPEAMSDVAHDAPAESWPSGPAPRASLGGSSSPAQPVDPEDVVRGLDLSADEIVTVSDAELVSIAPERSRTIEIEEFVDLGEIDPVFYEKSYHVAPLRGSGAEKPYVLLHRAMQAAKMAGIGRFVLRTKPHLVAIRPIENTLALETLFFGDEVRDAQPLSSGLSDITISERELKTAQQLIRALAKKWSASSHADTYREELLQLLRAKTPATPAPAAETAETPIGDLMAALRASVEAAKRRQDGSKAPASKKAG